MSTVRQPRGDPGSAGSTDERRYAPGTVLAARYRIVGLLGRGGMGEVYRADDLKLGQPVALKFLPQAVTGDKAWLRRFHDEVRIAREVAHPNVCRVYDIAEVDGEHFITMEFVDGEDLASLLRRIGRLPRDKALEITRQLCAGIAAAHDKNVLHRDLKPANIMLDGRGRVRITDFGVAALADKVNGKEIRAGTPAYMAPEQLAGKGVTRRSDIYSLGLVLYEIFTGRAAFEADSSAKLERLRQSGPPTTPSSHVDDIDPLAERVIMRCLENEPADRPGSAIAVAAALPGADPLAMALAAGETPSPEMLAVAGQRGGLRPAVAVPCLAGLVVIAGAWIGIKSSVGLLSAIPLDKPPQVLVDRAQQVATALGYSDRPADTAWWFSTKSAYLDHVKENDQSQTRWDRLASGRPPVVALRYRMSPETMVPSNMEGQVGWNDPRLETPGMVRMEVDGEGRLLKLEAVAPAEREVSADTTAPDWTALFEAAGLDPDAFTPTDPTRTPLVHCDTRAAWVGAFPEAPDIALRVEAGSFEGRPVYFELLGPWNEPRGSTPPLEAGDRIVITIFLTLFLLIPVAGAFIAVRNLRAGRGDRKGATWLAIYVFTISMGGWLLTADHALSLGEWAMLWRAFANATGSALICWILYLAIEPYARRQWPHAMISWSRLLSGRFRDPLVGRDILVGCIAGALICLTVGLTQLSATLLDRPPPAPLQSTNLEILRGGRYVAGGLLGAQKSVGIWIGAFVLLLLLRMVLRRQWLAVVAFYVVLLGIFSGGFAADPEDWLVAIIFPLLILVTMIRFGLLSLVVMGLVVPLLIGYPTTVDFSSWHAGAGAIGPAAALALGVAGFWISLAGRPLFRDELLQT